MDDAAGAYRDVLGEVPGHARGPGSCCRSDHAQPVRHCRSGVEREDLYERGRNLFRTAQYDKALEAFGKLLEQEPGTVHRAETLFRTGLALYNLGKRTEAAAVLERMTAEYPRDERAAEALYWTGKAYSKLGERERAVKTFQKLLSRHPESEWADDSLFVIGNVYREAGDLKKALDVLRPSCSRVPGQQVRGQRHLVDGLAAVLPPASTAGRTRSSRS